MASGESGPNKRMKLTGAAILVSRGMKVLQAARQVNATLAAARCSSTGDSPAVRPTRSKLLAMGLLTFSINVTLDGCVDHQEGIADDETRALFTRLMDERGAMLWGRVTYEMMESSWPAVARGDEQAPPAMRE